MFFQSVAVLVITEKALNEYLDLLPEKNILKNKKLLNPEMLVEKHVHKKNVIFITLFIKPIDE